MTLDATETSLSQAADDAHRHSVASDLYDFPNMWRVYFGDV